jgi:hypothetical protein
MMTLRFGFLRFPQHLQTMLFQLLGVDRLLGAALMRLRVLRPALATIRTIAAITAASATAAAIAPSATRFLSVLARRAVAVLGSRIGSLGRALLLLRARMPLLVGLPLALRARCLRLISLLRTVGLLPVLPRLLLLRGALVAPVLLVGPAAAIAALLVGPAAASVALVVAPAVAASVTATSSAASVTPMLMAVARFVARAFLTLGAWRPCGTHRRFIGRRGLFRGLV